MITISKNLCLCLVLTTDYSIKLHQFLFVLWNSTSNLNIATTGKKNNTTILQIIAHGNMLLPQTGSFFIHSGDASFSKLIVYDIF